MTAPVLPLKLEHLSTAASVASVGAWMLFPDDETWRRKFTYYFTAREGLNLFRAGLIPTSGVDDLVRMALHAAPIEDIERESLERRKYGYGAGLILFKACPRIVHRESTPMAATLSEVQLALSGKKASASKHVNDMVWRKYRPVAALWAAFVFNDDGSDGEIAFPCSPAELPAFLELSEAFRELGEKTIPKRRADPILAPGVSVQLSPEVKAGLPGGTLVIRNAD